jgi:hypothetical protein
VARAARARARSADRRPAGRRKMVSPILPTTMMVAAAAVTVGSHAPFRSAPYTPPATRVLAGSHYFAGWYNPCSSNKPADAAAAAGCYSHFHGYTPSGQPTTNWFPYYPERTPLLGMYTVDEATVAREVNTADRALDFFDILYYDGGAECGHPHDPGLSWCLDSSLAFMLNSTTMWGNTTGRLHFFISYSNDIDRNRGDCFVGPAGDTKWAGLVETWSHAMAHPRYLKINQRPVFKILIPEIFLQECGGNLTLANVRLAELRAAAKALGLRDPLIGGGWQNPSIPAISQQTPRPHPEGYMRYLNTQVDCPGGCTIKSVAVTSVQECQAHCNATSLCVAIEVDHTASHCTLLSGAGPGGPGSTDTYVRVLGSVQYEWTGSYNAAPPVCPSQPNWECAKYVNSWMPNRTSRGAEIFPYAECGHYQGSSRTNHSNDTVPYLPNVIAGFDPRPWEEHAPSFSMPNETEWEAVIRQVIRQCLIPANRFGFPDASAPHGYQPAFNIYAWNEYGEGGILAPSQGQGYMKVQVLANVMGIENLHLKTDDAGAGSTTRVTLASPSAVATVVIPEGASAAVKQAAEELSYHVSKMAGTQPLPIQSLAQPPPNGAGQGTYVFVGNVSWALSLETSIDLSQLPPEGGIIKAHNDSWLFVIGKNDSCPDPFLTGSASIDMHNDTLTAVYTLLDSLGVTWIWPGPSGEVIPSVSHVTAPVDGDRGTSSPPLLQRHLRPIYSDKEFEMWRTVSRNEATDHALSSWFDASQFATLQFNERRWLQRMRMGMHATPPWGQAFMAWWNQYNQTHPDYFALQSNHNASWLVDGRGPVVASEPDRVKMCVSNPDLWSAIADGGTAHNHYGLSAAEDDSNTGYCTCSRCRAWDNPNVTRWDQPGASPTGSLSDRYARFFDSVAAVQQAKSPAASSLWTTAYAYEQYRDPPKHYKIKNNVMMGFVGFGYPALPEENADDKHLWSGWFQAGARRMFWRPNCLIAGDGLPYMFADAIANDFSWLSMHGLAATDFDSLMGHWAAAGANYFVTARMHWRPQQTNVSHLMSQWTAAFGSASAQMNQYLQFWTDWTYEIFTSNSTRARIQNLTRSISKQAGSAHGWYRNVPYVYLAGTFDSADRLLSAARTACLDATCRARVSFMQTGSTHARLVAEAINASRFIFDISGRGLNRTSLVSVLRAATALTDFRKQIVASGSINVMWAQYNEVRLGDYTSVALAADLTRVMSIPQAHGYQPWRLTPQTNWLFQLDLNHRGIIDRWYNSSWREGNWTRMGCMDGWNVAPSMHKWQAANPHSVFRGAAWWRVSFAGHDLVLKAPPADIALALSAACGSMQGWLNGVPMTKLDAVISPKTPVILRMPPNALNLHAEKNIIALRFEDANERCATLGGAGLHGQVTVLGRPPNDLTHMQFDNA